MDVPFSCTFLHFHVAFFACYHLEERSEQRTSKQIRVCVNHRYEMAGGNLRSQECFMDIQSQHSYS